MNFIMKIRSFLKSKVIFVISLTWAIRIYINKRKKKFCLNFELAAPYKTTYFLQVLMYNVLKYIELK